MDQYRDLITQARLARDKSYSPYSRFRVGAALLGKSGQVYLGTNVENASFGLSNCAERTAIFRAVSDGEQEFEAIAICADGAQPTSPCGACRQVMIEFAPEMKVLLAGDEGADGTVAEFTVAQLLPDAFITFKSEDEEGTS